MAAKWNDLLEHAIVGKLVETLVDEGFRVEICDQDGGGLFVYGVPDGGQKPDGGFEYWARLVPGNGTDVIVDYTTNLENIIKPVDDLAAIFRE